jgi:hypothetical protein
MKMHSYHWAPHALALLTFVRSTFAATHYVDLNSANPTPPYTNWATAARVIQDAVDVAPAGEEVVVTNGQYRPIFVNKPLTLRSVNGPQFTTINGGGTTRCANLDNSATLSGFTLTSGFAIDDGGGVTGGTLTNCTLTGNVAEAQPFVSGGNGAYAGGVGNANGGGAAHCTLNNCILTGNVVQAPLVYDSCGSGYAGPSYSVGNAYGGGAAYCTLNNCTLTDNQALIFFSDPFDVGPGFCVDLDNSVGRAAGGGGVCGCTLTNCTLRDNLAQGYYFDGLFPYRYPDGVYVPGYGGGTFDSTLNNCTLTGNSASDAGGGAFGGTLNNCIVYFNSDSFSEGNFAFGDFNYCCTTPQPTNGLGNITNAPMFVDLASGNLRLQPNSPCINAGDNDYVSATTDLDGNPRILGGTVDIGAYEFVGPELRLQHLIELVNDSGLSAKQPLLATLEAALASVRRGNTVSAVNQLRAFQNKVNTQVEPTDASLAAALTNLSRDIVGALDGAK